MGLGTDYSELKAEIVKAAKGCDRSALNNAIDQAQKLGDSFPFANELQLAEEVYY